MPEDNNVISKEEQDRIEEIFKARCIGQRIKYESKTFFNIQVEFFSGAMAALNKVPPIWSIYIMSGRPIIKLYKLN